MKILFVMPPNPGAGVKRLCEILFHLNESPDAVHRFTVVCREGEFVNLYNNTEIREIRVTKSEPSSNAVESALRAKLGAMPARWDYLRGVVKEIRGEAFDHVVLENCPELASAVSKAVRMPLILHAHDRFFGKDRRNWQSCIRYFRKILFVSDFLRTSALACRIPDALCVTLHDVVDTEQFDASLYADIRREKRAKYDLGDEDMLAVFVGLLTPDKGALELTKAMAQSEFSDVKFKLLLVGSAQYGENLEDDYRAQLESAAPEGRVIFIGSVKPTSTARFLARADFAVVPSVFDEPAGLPVLEALSSGLPLIVSDAGGIGEYASGDAVITVDRGLGYVTSLAAAMDAMCEHLQDPETRRNLSEAARKQALQFDAADYLTHFTEAIQ